MTLTRVGLPDGMRLCVPYNQRPELLDELEPVARHVAWLYLPFHPDEALSARVFAGAGSAQAYNRGLEAVAARCAALGVGLNLVANAPHWAVDAAAVSRTLERLRPRVPALKVTFADLLAAREVRRLLPWVKVSVSCLADVQTPVQARWWREQAGAETLVASREVNRRPDRLAALAATGMTLSVVTFDDCIPGCQSRSCHFRPGPGNGAFRGTCDPGSSAVRRAAPWMLAQKEVLPGHLRHLAGIVTEVKLSGRDQPTSEIMRRVRLYLEARSLEHPNGYYREPARAWRRIAACRRDCERCGWCPKALRWSPLAGEGVERARPGEFALDLPGGRLRLWLEPAASGKRPLRRAGAHGIFYHADPGVAPALVERVLALAEKALKGARAPEDLPRLLEAAGLKELSRAA